MAARTSVCLSEGVYDYIRQLVTIPFLLARHIPATFDHLKTKANTEPLQRLSDYVDLQCNSVFFRCLPIC